MDYYVVIPAHNEEAFLAAMLSSVLGQSLPPKKVVVVNDNSTDNTQEIIDAFTSDHSNFYSVKITTSSDHVPGSKVVYAFNQGLRELDDNYDFLVKLDADIILPENYFEKIAYIFAGHPEVGIAGGFIHEQTPGGDWKLNHPMNKDHVRGALKSYTRSCFKAIGGLKTAMGWDTVDELLAQYHGFDIFTDNALVVKHLRPVGIAYEDSAVLLQGEAMYSMGYGFWITVIASIKMAWRQKRFKILMDNLVGFSKARNENKPYMVSQEEGKFIRKLRWKKIKSKLF